MVKVIIYEMEEVETTSLSSFVGEDVTDKEPTKILELPCFYKKNEVEYDESFVGFNQVIDGRIYLSHAQLIQAFGTYKPDGRFIEFELNGTTFNVVKVLPLEELFGKCISTEFQLKDKLRG